MASNSILKLQVDDRQYEASLKSAQQGLQALMNALRNSGKSFSDLDKNTEQYVRALGNMEATAKTTRGRIGEMSSAFVELSQVEKQLTDQERQSPVGKALTESLDQLKQRTIEAKKELADLDKQLMSQKAPETTDGGLLSKLGGKMDGALAVFGGNLMTKAAGMGVGLVTEMTDAVKQGIELAKAGEGVRIAFERLGRGDILQGLREATHGTVTDLELMKAAVKFNDFKLPVEELGTMLAFAQQKAKDTGQSVDYMVDSIVTGLGRKSLMILDNLGLSATEIRNKMKETGDMTKAVGAIIREQMAAAGDYVETAADRAAQANVSLQNKMEELGRKVAPLEESFNNLWTSMKVGILDVIGGPLTDLLNKLTQAGRMANQYSLMGGNTKVGRMTSNLANASEDSRQSIYQLQKSQFWKYINPREQQIQDIRAWQSGERNETLQKRINVITQKYGSLDTTKIQAEVDAAKKMLADYEQSAKSILQSVNAGINTKQAEQNVSSLRKQLKELEKQRKNAVKVGDQEQVENLTKQISQVKTNLGYLDPKTNKTGSSTKTVQTEIQQNQTKINTLTQEYVKLGDESTDAARKRQAEIQKEIELLQQRNGLLGLRAEQAQGRLLSTDDMKRKAEIDMQVNTKQIEDLRRQLAEIEKTTATVNVDATNSPDFLSFSKGMPKPREVGSRDISTKSVTITATDEALPKLREIEGINIDDKTMTVTAETTDALRALQGIEGVTIDPKSVTITATDEALPKLREIEGITIDDKTMTVTAETADALRAVQAIDGVTIDPKSVTITATDEALPKLREIEGITIDDKTMTVTAETADALRALQGIEGVTIDPKTVTITATDEDFRKQLAEIEKTTATVNVDATNSPDFLSFSKGMPKPREAGGIGISPKSVTITATDEALPKLREIEGITIDDKTMTVTADTADALRALQGIEGVTIDPKTVTITATDEALPKLREIEGITIDDKTMTVTAETTDALRALQGIEGVTIDPKTVTITATDEDFRKQLAEIEKTTATVNVDATHSPDFLGFSKGAAKPREAGGRDISTKSVIITATDEAMPKLREIEGITIDDKTMTVTAETADALRALQGIEGVTIDPKSVTITATDEALPKLREIEGVTIDDKTMTITADTADALRALQGIEGVTIDQKTVTITTTDEALPKLREIEGITIDDKTMTVTAETADALRALQSIEGVTIEPKTTEVNANTSEAQQKIDELKAKIAELEDKNINIQAFVESIGKPLGEGLNKTPETLLKAPETDIPRGGLQLDDKEMKAVRKNIDDSLPKKEKKDSPMDSSKKMLNAISQLTGGLQQMGIELPSEIQGVIGVIQGAMQVIEAVNTIIGVTQTTALTANTAAMISLEAALWANTATSIIPFANGGIVPGFANGGVIESGHSTSFLSFSKAAPAFATGGVVPQTFTSLPKFTTGGIIHNFNEGGTVEAGHAPDFISFSKAMSKFATGGVVPQTITSMPKFATGGIIQKFNEGGTVEAGHAPDFISFSKAMPRRFASGGTVPHAANGYFIGGSHFSGDVTPIMANAGELVLNKAQQGVIANQLQGGNNNNVDNRQPYVNGELIYLGLNNYLKRTGRGEIVVSKR